MTDPGKHNIIHANIKLQPSVQAGSCMHSVATLRHTQTVLNTTQVCGRVRVKRYPNSCPDTAPTLQGSSLLVPRTHGGFLKALESLWETITHSLFPAAKESLNYILFL